VGQRYGEVVGTSVGGFNHSDAICSTQFFALTVDIFPGEMREVCLQLCVYVCVCVGVDNTNDEGQNTMEAEHSLSNILYIDTVQPGCLIVCL